MRAGPLGTLALALGIGGFFAFHLPLIEADTPARLGVVRLDSGDLVDEGYKTYDSRNEILFGSVRWNPADEYGGNWSEGSPLNTALNSATFRAVGVDLVAVRILNLFFAAGCLVLFWVLLRGRFEGTASLIGVFLLLLHPLFVVQARLALLEVKLLFFCMLAVVLMPARLEGGSKALVRWGGVALALTAAFLTKETAVVFTGTLALGLGAWVVASRVERPGPLQATAVGVVLVGIGLFASLAAGCSDPDACGFMNGRIPQSPTVAFPDLVSADLFLLNPAVALLSVLGGASVLRRTLGTGGTDRNDLVILVWAVIPAFFFAALDYQPSRYFLLVLPALLWLSVEALTRLTQLKVWLFGPARDPWAVLTLALAGLTAVVSFAPNLLSGVRIGGDPGVEATALVGPRLGPWLVAAALVAAGILHLSSGAPKRLGAALFRPGIAGLALLGIGIGVWPVASWAADPPRELEAAAPLLESLGDDAVLAGDWAPQLGFRTRLRTLYSAWNPGLGYALNLETLDQVGTSHLVIAEGAHESWLERVRERYPGAAGTEPVLRFPYGGRWISVYEFRPTENESR